MAAPKTQAARRASIGSMLVGVPVRRSTVLFVAESADDALHRLAEWWRTTPEINGEAVSDEFRFVADEHEFVVTVKPIVRSSEADLDWVNRADRTDTVN